MKKYKITDIVHPHHPNKLRRVRALRSFADVAKGDLGGWIEFEHNLSHEGDCWVYDQGRVYGNGGVYDSGAVYGYGTVYDNGAVYGYGTVHDNGKVYGHGHVRDHAQVVKNGEVFCGATASAASVIRWALDETPVSINTSDEYTMTLNPSAGGWISAGCRYFSLAEAREHWATTRAGTPLGQERLRCLDFLEAIYKDLT